MNAPKLKMPARLNKIRHSSTGRSTIYYSLMFTSVLVACGIYSLRVAFQEAGEIPNINNWYPIIPFYIIPAVMLIIMYFLFIYVLGSWTDELNHTLAVLLVSILLAVVLPLPPTSVEKIFRTHRAEFEEIVAFSRQYQLENEPQFAINIKPLLPEKYKSLKVDSIWVFRAPDGIIVVFGWKQYPQRLVYFTSSYEMRSAMATIMQPQIQKRLGGPWFIVLIIV
jgi:hypothetical protein